MKFDSRKIIAAAIAILIHIGVALILMWNTLIYPGEEYLIPEPAQTNITFGGEFVAMGDMETPDLNDQPNSQNSADSESTPSGQDNENAGEPGDGSTLVSTDNESEMTSEKKANGPSKEELAEKERAKKEQERQKNESKKINKNIKNAFSKSNQKGKSGSESGNSETGLAKGQPGHTLGIGYTLASWGRPSSGFDGTIEIQVKVNSAGNVTYAKYLRGTGAAAANQRVRRSCEQASLNSKFSVPKNATGEKMGTIIWRFE